jgi:biopolymer transport protein ExbB
MTFDLAHIFRSMSPVNKAIAIALCLMALAAVAITVERLVALSKSGRASRLFAKEAELALRAWDRGALLDLAMRYRASLLARLFEQTLRRFDASISRPEGGMSPVEAARNEAVRTTEALGAELRRGMGALATIGSITPFVGLLGTVVGIIAAFQAIGSAGAGGLGTVSVGIAEALIETALGLSVAIPSVMSFNYLTNRVGAIESALGRSAGQLLDEMEYHHGHRTDEDRTSGVHDYSEAA